MIIDKQHPVKTLLSQLQKLGYKSELLEKEAKRLEAKEPGNQEVLQFCNKAQALINDALIEFAQEPKPKTKQKTAKGEKTE
jgi:hypothetical protein